ncbi:MAG: 16S rRNA (adenine(1518)-N(6)/adenine(1519)-N(6))-dimethyltransferase RsmA [bacterium]
MKKVKNNRNSHAYDTSEPRKKKSLGQHFLRKQSTVDNMVSSISITPDTSVLEIGCGDGFLTQTILKQTNCKQLLCFEIDHEWAMFVKKKIDDPRLTIKVQNILEVDLAELKGDMPWVILSNIPYNITFPILFLIQKNKDLFQEGVVMIQEEVAQKIVASKGKNYGPTSLFLQYYFDFKLLEKIEPEAFNPPPKVFSRLLYFKPKKEQTFIPDAENFWKFLKYCFRFPRRMLNNNLKATPYEKTAATHEFLNLRAQQLSFNQFLEIWKQLIQ